MLQESMPRRQKYFSRKISDEEILERCIYPMINEGAKILEEGKAIRSSDIDIVWINGYGFPVYRGGPMFYGDTVGADKVLAKMKMNMRLGDMKKLWKRLDRDESGARRAARAGRAAARAGAHALFRPPARRRVPRPRLPVPGEQQGPQRPEPRPALASYRSYEIATHW